MFKFCHLTCHFDQDRKIANGALLSRTVATFTEVTTIGEAVFSGGRDFRKDLREDHSGFYGELAL